MQKNYYCSRDIFIDELCNIMDSSGDPHYEGNRPAILGIVAYYEDQQALSFNGQVTTVDSRGNVSDHYLEAIADYAAGNQAFISRSDIARWLAFESPAHHATYAW